MRALVLALALSCTGCAGVFEPGVWVWYGRNEGLGVEGAGPHTFGLEDYQDAGVMIGGTWRRAVAPQPHPLDLASRAWRPAPERVPTRPPPVEPPADRSLEDETDPHDGHGVAVDVMDWFGRIQWGPWTIAALGLLVVGLGFAAWAAVAYFRRRRNGNGNPKPAATE